MKEDGSKKQGRFLKGSSPLIKKVRIEEFSFKDISTRPMAYPDNPIGNIVHSWLHEPAEIAKIIKPASQLFEDLLDPSLKAPVIRPRDFTGDWLEERRKQRRRSSNQYADEDEFEMAMEEEKVGKKNINKEGEEQEEEKKAEESVNPENVAPDLSLDTNSLVDLKKSDGATMDQVGQAIKGFNETVGELSQSSLVINSKNSEMSKNIKSQNIDNEDLSKSQSEEREKEISKAYNAGMEDGLAKARESMKEKEADLSALKLQLKTVLAKLEQEPKEILKQCESNFFELTAAICENLLNNEFTADPSKFKKLVLRAVAEGINEKDYSIKVSKRAFDLLNSEEKLADTWTIAPEFKDFEFKIVSENGDISSNLQNIVSSLIKELDVKLFMSPSEVENKDTN